MLNLNPWYVFVMQDVITKDNIANRDSDELRYSILNTLFYILAKVIKKTYKTFVVNCNAPEDKHDLLQMKNEYLYKRMLITEGKKNYAAITEFKEGKFMDGELDCKGITINKISTNAEVSAFFLDLLENDILKAQPIPNMSLILNKLQDFEQSMKDSLSRGEKTFLKPKKVKDPSVYADPMSDQGVRAVMNWETMYPDRAIEFPDAVSIVKMTLSRPKEIEKFKTMYPDIYEKYREIIFENEDKKIRNKGIHVFAIPSDEDTIPEWVRPFIDIETIVHDNMKNIIPILKALESESIQFTSNDKFFSNIITF